MGVDCGGKDYSGRTDEAKASAGIMGQKLPPARMATVNLNDISRTEQLVAIVVGLGTYFLFVHFHFIPAGYESARIVVRIAFVLGASLVFLTWPLFRRKKKAPKDPL
jgi:hypothetical protein